MNKFSDEIYQKLAMGHLFRRCSAISNMFAQRYHKKTISFWTTFSLFRQVDSGVMRVYNPDYNSNYCQLSQRIPKDSMDLIALLFLGAWVCIVWSCLW